MQTPSASDENAVLIREGQNILGKIRESDRDRYGVEGEHIDSVELARKFGMRSIQSLLP